MIFQQHHSPCYRTIFFNRAVSTSWFYGLFNEKKHQMFKNSNLWHHTARSRKMWFCNTTMSCYLSRQLEIPDFILKFKWPSGTKVESIRRWMYIVGAEYFECPWWCSGATLRFQKVETHVFCALWRTLCPVVLKRHCRVNDMFSTAADATLPWRWKCFGVMTGSFKRFIRDVEHHSLEIAHTWCRNEPCK